MNNTEQMPPWATHFRIDSSTWQTLCSQATRQKATALDIALDMGLLNENKLLEYDRQASMLLCLKSTFFNGPLPLQLLKNFNYQKCRAKACMPVGEWDGQLIWAKLSSQNTGFEQEYEGSIWILAPWSGLKKWFGAWEQSAPKQEATPKPATAKTAPNVSQIKAEATNVVASASQELPPPAPTDSGDGAPAGLVEQKVVKLPNIDFSKITINPKFEPATKPAAAPTPPPAVPEEEFFGGSEPKPVPVSKAPEIQKIPEAQILTSIKSATSHEALAQALMGGWLNYFDKTMVFLFQGGRLFVWKWGGAWSIQFKGAEIIPLNDPSMFKFVVDSKYPFHGPPSRGPINESFFKRTNNGEFPEHVTLLPVLSEQKITALLLGASTKAGKNIPLDELQSQCTAFANGMLKLLNAAPKAG